MAKPVTTLLVFILITMGNLLAQTRTSLPHPAAAKALEQIVLKKAYGENLQLYSREAITMMHNDSVTGLNGLMFIRWKGSEPGIKIMASMQWFEDKDDLLQFYAETMEENDYRMVEFKDTPLWMTGEKTYMWTDRQHFLVSLGGSPCPPDEMLQGCMQLISSRISETDISTKTKPPLSGVSRITQ